MLFTDKVLEFFMQPEEGSEEAEEIIELSELDLLKEEIKSVITEMSTYHGDSKEYSELANNLKTLMEAYNFYTRAEAEKDKVELQAEEIKKRKQVDWTVVLPKLGGVAASVLLTLVWFAVEREHPVPMRLIQEINSLSVPRGL